MFLINMLVCSYVSLGRDQPDFWWNHILHLLLFAQRSFKVITFSSSILKSMSYMTINPGLCSWNFLYDKLYLHSCQTFELSQIFWSYSEKLIIFSFYDLLYFSLLILTNLNDFCFVEWFKIFFFLWRYHYFQWCFTNV